MDTRRDSFFGKPYKPGQERKIPKPDLKIVEEIVIDSIDTSIITMHIVNSGIKIMYNKSSKLAYDENGNSIKVPYDIDCTDYWTRLRLANIFEHVNEQLAGFKA